MAEMVSDCMTITPCSKRLHNIARDAMATALATWFPTDVICQNTQNPHPHKNQSRIIKLTYNIPAWRAEFYCFMLYLLACFLQDLEAVTDEFWEIVLLNVMAVPWCRTVHDHQLLQDTQVQLCPLDVIQLENKETGTYLLQLATREHLC